VAYDGNGNVGALVDAANGTVAARYEYGPFAEPIRVTGTMAKANPLCFSTKYTDREGDLLYYGYRHYNPSSGRWLSRDPYGELGNVLMGIGLPGNDPSVNVSLGNDYAFVLNDPQNLSDLLGLKLTFQHVACHGCNAGWTSIGGRKVGYVETPPETPCVLAPGGSGSFGHACANTLLSSGLCDSETRIQVIASNNSPCCQRYLITCEWSYTGTSEGTENAVINVHFSFLGEEFYHLADFPRSGSVRTGPFTASGKAMGFRSDVVYIAPGATIDVFKMLPANIVRGRPDSIAEVGRVSCTAQCAGLH